MMLFLHSNGVSENTYSLARDAGAAANHPGRAVHRARCRLSALDQECAARARPCRLLRDHDDAYLDVAERMADRIGVMVAGQLLAEGNLDELRRQAGAGHGSLEDTFLALVETGAEGRTVAA